MARHQIKIVRSRQPVTSLDYTPQQMAEIGEVGRQSMYDRMRLGVDVNDRVAPPLKRPVKAAGSGPFVNAKGEFSLVREVKGYPHYKVVKYGGKPIRDWWRTGQTLRAMKVIRASVNQVIIGFTTPLANKRASLNNQRWRQFGLSPRDLQAVMRAISAVKSRREQVA